MTGSPCSIDSTEAKIRAIEAKLRHMERSKEEMTLSSKPVVEPGTSRYSHVQQAKENQSSKPDSKTYSKPYGRVDRKK